jgi:hypothetical protein
VVREDRDEKTVEPLAFEFRRDDEFLTRHLVGRWWSVVGGGWWLRV